MIRKYWLYLNTACTWIGTLLLVWGLAMGQSVLPALLLLAAAIAIRVVKLRCPHCRSNGLYATIARYPSKVVCPNCGKAVHFE